TNGAQKVNSSPPSPVQGRKLTGAPVNAPYAGAMDSPQIALLALALGVAIGVGLCLPIAWAYRARARAEEETSLAIPEGINDVLDSMDDAACVVDASGLVMATSLAAERFGIVVGATLESHELRQLVRTVLSTGAPDTETLR